MTQSEVAVMGAGRMGSAMARRLAEAGHNVRVWNRSEDAAVRLVESIPSGTAVVASTPARAVEGADVVLSMLADGDSTVAVLTDPALVEAVDPRAVVVNLATTGVPAVELVAVAFRAAGRRVIDAPVSGSVATVLSGSLLVMASGEARDVDDAREVLSSFASTVLHVGAYGAGQVMKLGLNLVVLGVNALVSEALVLVERSGIDAASAYDVLEASVASSPFVRYKRPAFLDDATPVAMSLELTAKDMRLVGALAHDVAVDLPTTAAVGALVQAAVEHGYGDRDMAALRRFVAERGAQ